MKKSSIMNTITFQTAAKGRDKMFYNAKNQTIKLDNTEMDFISFGMGKKNVILIPGLGDGLRTVKGTAIPFAFMYREYTKEYKVYVFSRKKVLEEGYTTRDMARDMKIAMEKVGIEKADIVGVSQGGMIAQYIAIDYPEVVNKLVLAVTVSRSNALIENVVGTWMEWAQQGKYTDIQIDTAEKMYTEAYLKKNRWMYPLLGIMGKPKDGNRFLLMAKACLTHNAYDELNKIKMPCLVIGAKQDQVVGGKASEEIAKKIEGSLLYMYPDYGHGVFEEAKDFNQRIREFLG